MYKSSVSPGFAKQNSYNGSLVTWTVVSLTTARFKQLNFFFVWLRLVFAANMFIHMILYDFCLLYGGYSESNLRLFKATNVGAVESSRMRGRVTRLIDL
jgi:hypothetical protein